MSDDASVSAPAAPPHERIFLVVVDETEEMRVALRYAALRAFHTGGKVALLSVVEPPGIAAIRRDRGADGGGGARGGRAAPGRSSRPR